MTFRHIFLLLVSPKWVTNRFVFESGTRFAFILKVESLNNRYVAFCRFVRLDAALLFYQSAAARSPFQGRDTFPPVMAVSSFIRKTSSEDVPARPALYKNNTVTSKFSMNVFFTGLGCSLEKKTKNIINIIQCPLVYPRSVRPHDPELTIV